MKNICIGYSVLCVILVVSGPSCTPKLSDNTGKLDIQLFLGDSLNRPLIVGFGGSEGGNAWASDYWKEERARFLQEGYAFMAIGYFGMDGIPSKLDRISLDAIRDSIVTIAKRHPSIDPNNITIMGGSKGGELVLNLGSHFKDFHNVIAIVPSHVSFPALTITANTSSWTLYGTDITYVPATWETLPATLKRDFHEAFSIMLQDRIASRKARIPVENINGNILLVSATEDEMWPSTAMSNRIITHLDTIGFRHRYKHVEIVGKHNAPLKHFHVIREFLRE